MIANWDPRTTLGILNTHSISFACVARRGDRRCQRPIDQGKKEDILPEIDNMPETAPANPALEAAALKKIALLSLCQDHRDSVHVANAVRRWQQALIATRAVLATTRALQSEGISNFDDSRDDDDDSAVSSLGSSDSDGDSDDGFPPNGDDTTSTTISNFNPEPNEAPETEELRERLAQVTLEAEALREQIERTTPQLNELRQQLARATPEAEVEDLRKQVERATPEMEQLKLESDQIRYESAQSMLDNERFRHENQRLEQRLDQISRICADLDAEPRSEEGQSESFAAQPRHIAVQTQESDMRSDEAESNSGTSP